MLWRFIGAEHSGGGLVERNTASNYLRPLIKLTFARGGSACQTTGPCAKIQPMSVFAVSIVPISQLP